MVSWFSIIRFGIGNTTWNSWKNLINYNFGVSLSIAQCGVQVLIHIYSNLLEFWFSFCFNIHIWVAYTRFVLPKGEQNFLKFCSVRSICSCSIKRKLCIVLNKENSVEVSKSIFGYCNGEFFFFFLRVRVIIAPSVAGVLTNKSAKVVQKVFRV